MASKHWFAERRSPIAARPPISPSSFHFLFLSLCISLSLFLAAVKNRQSENPTDRHNAFSVKPRKIGMRKKRQRWALLSYNLLSKRERGLF